MCTQRDHQGVWELLEGIMQVCTHSKGVIDQSQACLRLTILTLQCIVICHVHVGCTPTMPSLIMITRTPPYLEERSTMVSLNAVDDGHVEHHHDGLQTMQRCMRDAWAQ